MSKRSITKQIKKERTKNSLMITSTAAGKKNSRGNIDVTKTFLWKSSFCSVGCQSVSGY